MKKRIHLLIMREKRLKDRLNTLKTVLAKEREKNSDVGEANLMTLTAVKKDAESGVPCAVFLMEQVCVFHNFYVSNTSNN